MFSGAVFAGIIAVPALAYWCRLLPEVPAFWFAYILTRPLGASFADWSAVSPARGGLGWGTGPVSLGLAVLITACVVRLNLLQRRSARSETPAG
ncbi:hypothetical protein [Arthrobacter sp. NPDC057013]|uniref:hypothetical protein n=1 Tax=Arthrobacter sp. NPDC057013 TaxID=3345999 RepID=UPI003636E9AE